MMSTTWRADLQTTGNTTESTSSKLLKTAKTTCFFSLLRKNGAFWHKLTIAVNQATLTFIINKTKKKNLFT